MVAWETAALKAAGTVGSRAGRMWLAQRSAAADRGKDLTELIRVNFRDGIARRKVQHQLDGIVLAVLERLQPLCEQEFRGLDDADKAAVLAELADVLERADLSDEAVLGADADPTELARQVRAQVPRRRLERELGEAGARMFDVLLEECCEDLMQIVVALPQFTERASAETLSRLSGISDQVEAALVRLPKRTLDAPEGEDDDEEFGRRYARHISQVLDNVELFGIQVKRYQPRTSLSVAYISLTVSAQARRKGRDGEHRGHLALTDADSVDPGEPRTATMQVESALGDARRMLIRGEAGSGKSTLLRWLAITAVRDGFGGELEDWNGYTPFLIKLRSHAKGNLPSPEHFLEGTADPLADLMPKGWVHRRLTSGRALLLVDGVDELSTAQRSKVPTWLRDLLTAYPGVRVIVTSRPAAASARWLAGEGFSTAHLEPMSPTGLRELIRQWHQAIADVPHLPCAVEEIPGYESALLARLEGAPHLRSLAATPLLAAMLCALNLDHKTRLPRDRMGIYAATLEMLLDKRDEERDIPAFRDVELDYGQKLRLLQDLAWSLSSSQRSELPKTVVLRQVEERLTTMPGVRGESEPVTEYLLQRSGALREPVDGRVDFVHRTVQEYLTAKQAIHFDDVEYLVQKAHLSTWRETVIMAAGHANGPQLEELLGGILARVRVDQRHARNLKLLVAACLETAQTVPVELRDDIYFCVDDLIPPRDLATARSLATAGEMILERLPESLEGLSEAQARATVHAVALINGEHSLNILATDGYRNDSRKEIQLELQKSWSFFDSNEYAFRVLGEAPLVDGTLQVGEAGQLAALPHVSRLRSLGVDISGVKNLSFLSSLADLERLDVRRSEVLDLSELGARGSKMQALYASLAKGVDLNVLSQMPMLRDLYLIINGRTDVDFISLLPKLSKLYLIDMDDVEDYSPLSSQVGVVELWLQGCKNLTDVEKIPLSGRLRELSLTHSDLRCGLSEVVARAPGINTLNLSDCSWVTDLSPLSSIQLEILFLSGVDSVDGLDFVLDHPNLYQLNVDRTSVKNLDPVRGLSGLLYLQLEGCTRVEDLSPLSSMTDLRYLYLRGARPGLDLAPLAGLKDLSIYIYPGQYVCNREAFSGRVVELDW